MIKLTIIDREGSHTYRRAADAIDAAMVRMQRGALVRIEIDYRRYGRHDLDAGMAALYEIESHQQAYDSLQEARIGADDWANEVN